MDEGKRAIRAAGMLAAVAIVVSLAAGCASRATTKSAAPSENVAARSDSTAKEEEARDTAIEAYVYGYPLVTMEMTRRVMTNVAAPDGTRAPMGQLVRRKKPPSAAQRDVRAPNVDTLDATAWVDVSKEPWILTLPDMGERYFVFPMLDGWTNVFRVAGTRTMGRGAHKYAITGPGWNGALPNDMTEYKSPTALVWIAGRIACSGAADCAAAHAAQDGITLVPFSAYGKRTKPSRAAVDPSVDMKTAVRDQVDALDGVAFFTLLAELIKKNQPPVDDASMIGKLATIGVVLGKDFDAASLDPAVVRGIRSAPAPARAKILGWMKESIAAGDAKLEDGWFYTTKTGSYGTNYRQRALLAATRLGADRPQDLVAVTSEGPNAATRYDGTKRYVMRFEKGALPPVNAFWSLTMYDRDSFLVDNPIERYAIGERDKLKPNKDGSIDVYIQQKSPGKDKESNWLPAPAGEFILMMRLYSPSEKPPTILDGSWKVPRVREAS